MHRFLFPLSFPLVFVLSLSLSLSNLSFISGFKVGSSYNIATGLLFVILFRNVFCFLFFRSIFTNCFDHVLYISVIISFSYSFLTFPSLASVTLNPCLAMIPGGRPANMPGRAPPGKYDKLIKKDR